MAPKKQPAETSTKDPAPSGQTASSAVTRSNPVGAATSVTTATDGPSTPAAQLTEPQQLFHEDRPFPNSSLMSGLVYCIQELQQAGLVGEELSEQFVLEVHHEILFSREAVYYGAFYRRVVRFLVERHVTLDHELVKTNPREAIRVRLYSRPPNRNASASIPHQRGQQEELRRDSISRASTVSEIGPCAKVARNVASHFRESEKRFSGALQDNLQEFFDDFISVCQTNNVTLPDDWIKYLPIALDGEARRFFHLKMSQGHVWTFDELRITLEKEYNSKMSERKVDEHLPHPSFDEHLSTASDTPASLHKTDQKVKCLHQPSTSAVPRRPACDRAAQRRRQGTSMGFTFDIFEEHSSNKLHRKIHDGMQQEKQRPERSRPSSRRKPKTASNVGRRQDRRFLPPPRGQPAGRKPAGRKLSKGPTGPKSTIDPWRKSSNVKYSRNCRQPGHGARNCDRSTSRDIASKLLHQVLDSEVNLVEHDSVEPAKQQQCDKSVEHPENSDQDISRGQVNEEKLIYETSSMSPDVAFEKEEESDHQVFSRGASKHRIPKKRLPPDKNLLCGFYDDTRVRRNCARLIQALVFCKHLHTPLPLEMRKQAKSRDISVTPANLSKLQSKQFYHTLMEKFPYVIKTTRPVDLSTYRFEVIHGIVKVSHIYRAFGKTNRPKLHLSKVCLFKRKFAIDFRWMLKNFVLYVVKSGANFSFGVFIENESTTSCWKAFLRRWVTVCDNYTQVIRAGRDSVSENYVCKPTVASKGSFFKFVLTSMILITFWKFRKSRILPCVDYRGDVSEVSAERRTTTDCLSVGKSTGTKQSHFSDSN